MTKKPHTYKYVCVEHDATLEDAVEFGSEWSLEHDASGLKGKWIAQDAADCHHSQHEGWDCGWPMVYDIYTSENVFVGRFSVERHTVPEFEAVQIEAP